MLLFLLLWRLRLEGGTLLMGSLHKRRKGTQSHQGCLLRGELRNDATMAKNYQQSPGRPLLPPPPRKSLIFQTQEVDGIGLDTMEVTGWSKQQISAKYPPHTIHHLPQFTARHKVLNLQHGQAAPVGGILVYGCSGLCATLYSPVPSFVSCPSRSNERHGCTDGPH